MARKLEMLITTYMQSLGFLAKLVFCDLGQENPRFSLGEKSTEGFPRSAYKPKMQLHMGIYTPLENELFSAVFEVFDPLDFEIGAEKHARNADFQHTALLA